MKISRSQQGDTSGSAWEVASHRSGDVTRIERRADACHYRHVPSSLKLLRSISYMGSIAEEAHVRTVPESDQNGRWPNPRVAIGIVLIVSLTLTLVHFFTVWRYSYPRSAGEFGDMFGMANALFSGLALGGVVWALVIQQRQLGIQREELSLTRNELELTRHELAHSAHETEKMAEAQELVAILAALTTLYNDVSNRIARSQHETERRTLSTTKQALHNQIEIQYATLLARVDSRREQRDARLDEETKRQIDAAANNIRGATTDEH